ncbi:MAG: hypothetical protein V1493_05190 [Candidatus Diapherotrites archaeon]
MAKAVKIQKVILIDYDGPLAEKMALDERAMERLALLSRQGFRIAIITGRTPANMGECRKALERHGLAGRASLFCEHGCVECIHGRKGWKTLVHREVRSFKEKEKAMVADALARTARKNGFEGIMQKNVVSIYFSARNCPLPLKEMQGLIREEVERLNKLPGRRTKLTAIASRIGIEVLPAAGTKTLAAEKFLRRVGRPYSGFAFGDMSSDRKMARDSKIKFISAKSPREFLQKTEALQGQLEARRLRLGEILAKRRLGRTRPKGFFARLRPRR